MRAVLLALVPLAGCVQTCNVAFKLPTGDPQPDCCITDDDAPPLGPQPDFGPTVTAEVPPPAISGGTLTILKSGLAVAADPDRDRIYAVDLVQRQVVGEIALTAHDEPGRVIEDGAGRVHVVLRGGGAIATLDPATWTMTARRAVCPSPRGIAWDPATNLLHVACTGGELVSLPAASGAPTRTLTLDRDLRDVVIHQGAIVVSRFRTAELLRIDATTGAVLTRSRPALLGSFNSPFEPDAAWRIAVSPVDDAIYMVHQRAMNGVVQASRQGGYGGGDPCFDPIVHATVSVFDPSGNSVAAPTVMNAVVPVDFAIANHDDQIAIVSAGNAKVPGAPTVVTVTRTSAHEDGGGCDGDFARTSAVGGEPIAVAFTADDQLVVQSREPAQLSIGGRDIALSADTRADTGHAIFHANAGSMVACASCHLEGGDDARVWTFDNSGSRRTQSLRGGVIGTEPFHWDGDQADFGALMTEVFARRMAGPFLATDQLDAARGWVQHIPTLPVSPGDPAAITRGKMVFENAASAGCVTCHNGPQLTSNATVDVGTGQPFQVPRLVGVGDRAPFLHDGRAATLADRFMQGTDDKHGHTSQLTGAQIADLIAYLESL